MQCGTSYARKHLTSPSIVDTLALTLSPMIDPSLPMTVPEGRRPTVTRLSLPSYLRMTRRLDVLVPWLYLQGLDEGDLSDALGEFLGKDARGISGTTVGHLMDTWVAEFWAWIARPLHSRRFVYWWVEGTPSKPGPGDEDGSIL